MAGLFRRSAAHSSLHRKPAAQDTARRSGRDRRAARQAAGGLTRPTADGLTFVIEPGRVPCLPIGAGDLRCCPVRKPMPHSQDIRLERRCAFGTAIGLHRSRIDLRQLPPAPRDRMISRLGEADAGERTAPASQPRSPNRSRLSGIMPSFTAR